VKKLVVGPELNEKREETVMALELMEHTNGTSGTDKDTMYVLGGIALVVFGAGMILSNPLIRKYIGQMGLGSLALSSLPDIDRYLKLRAM
jgi:hypothetical protein